MLCKSLGYSTGTAVPNIGGGEGMNIWLSNLECDGSEDNVWSCGHDGWGTGLRFKRTGGVPPPDPLTL